MPPKIHILETKTTLPVPIEKVFAFFADAANLDALTPPWLKFRITTPMPIEMKVGALIDYRLSLRGVPIKWRTRISEWNPPHKFADEQLSGPYQRWYHTHTFESTPNGTICGDRIEYAHFGGPLVHRLLVRPDIEKIFAYRQQRLAEIFK